MLEDKEGLLLTDEEITAGVNTYGLAEGGLLISLSDRGRKEYQGVIEAQLTKVQAHYETQGIYLGKAILEETKKQERERILKIFASMGKIQLEKPLSGKEFEALFD